MNLFDNRTVIYKFVFEGMTQPIEVESDGGQTLARERLAFEVENHKREYIGKKILGQTCYTPVTNVTTKNVNGRTYVWVGKAVSETGWIEK